MNGEESRKIREDFREEETPGVGLRDKEESASQAKSGKSSLEEQHV